VLNQHVPRSRVNTRDPDPYDGSDPSKLRAFISQCRVVLFRSRPEEYRDCALKIMCAVSWLKGTAQRWFEPNLALEVHELLQYARVWDDFVDALKSTFGEPKPFTSATNKFDNLVMKDHHHLNKYDVEFNEYATLTGFNECVLFARYYKGLAPRLKDAMLYGPCSVNYTQLCELAQECKLHFWERRDEEKPKPAPRRHQALLVLSPLGLLQLRLLTLRRLLLPQKILPGPLPLQLRRCRNLSSST